MYKADKRRRSRQSILRSLPRFHADSGGQITMLTVFSAVILVSLLGMIITTGDQVSQKIHLQNSVDTAALSGGVWIARGMNITSGFNLLQTQLMSGAIVLRGLNQSLPIIQVIVTVQIAKNAACAAYRWSCARRLAITTFQEVTLQVLQPAVKVIHDILAICPSGLLWIINRALYWINAMVHQYFELIAMIETRDLAQLAGANAAILIPGPIVHEKLELQLPTRDTRNEPLNLHCDPMEYGSRQSRKRGYHQLAGYRLQEGPLGLGWRRLDRRVDQLGGAPSSLSRWVFRSIVWREKSALCRGDGPCSSVASFPYLLDDSNDGLFYLALSRLRNKKIFFSGEHPADPPDLLVYAQIEVYNAVNRNHPDTYTQDWRVRLAPASLVQEAVVSTGESSILIHPFIQTFLRHDGSHLGYPELANNH